MLGCKVVDNQVEKNKKLEESDESYLVDKGRYQRLVGRSIYLLHTCESHMKAVERILRYMKSSLGKKGCFLADIIT
jgi:hypothetical protein